MGLSAHLPAGSLRSLADTHPRLTALRTRLVNDLHIEPARAGRLVASLVQHAVEDLGDSFLGEMSRRLQRIDTIRGRIAGAIDHVVAQGLLPPDLDHASLSRLFDELHDEMQGLQNVRRFGESQPPAPGIEQLTGAVDTAGSGPHPAGFRPFSDSGDAAQGVVGARPPGMLRDAMTAMTRDEPARAAIFQRAMREQGDLVGLAVLAETEGAQRQALRDLRDAAGPELLANWAELEKAVEFMGTAQGRARRGPDTPAGAVRAQRVADMPDDLRAAIGGDNTLLGPLAEQSPADLQQLWDAWNSRGRGVDFRNYVYGEMRAGRRPALAEWQAAHDLANQHGLALLKDPASFDPSSPNLRNANPREGGTDLIGLRPDGEIWYVDDKSHRLSPSARTAGATGLNVSGVSAFEGRRFITNMFDDAADMEAAFQRMADAGHAPEPRAVEAAGRVRRAAEALQRETHGWSDADFGLPANQQRIAGILGAPEHRIRLRLTSAMGDVTGVTQRLGGLGIDVLPAFAPHPAPAGRLP